MASLSEERGAAAHILHQGIVEREEMRRKLLATNAAALAQMHEEGLYREMLGDPDGQWAGYLGEINIFYTRNQVDSFIKVYRKFTKELKIPAEAWVEVPITRLVDVLPIVTKDNWEELLVKGKTLTTRDWTIETRQLKGLLTEEEHDKHDDNFYRICKQCGRKQLVDSNHVHDKEA